MGMYRCCSYRDIDTGPRGGERPAANQTPNKRPAAVLASPEMAPALGRFGPEWRGLFAGPRGSGGLLEGRLMRLLGRAGFGVLFLVVSR